MVVFIAGVNQGLGLVLTEFMAEQGHTVYAGYRNKASGGLLAAAGRHTGIIPLLFDVTREDDARRAAREIGEKAGKLDAVIVVAGVLMQSDRDLLITDAAIDDLRTALEINVTGSAIVIKHFHALVKKGGFFITVTSEAGSMTNTGTKYSGYSISKAAQNKLTAIFAATVTDYTVYALHPGRMNTVMGRNDAQIEPIEAARSIYQILSGEKKVPSENGWFINYKGEAMEI
jgi:NAD(P)-dependent dehydrogenase (short-subunit alcohol dehydrogenase family)